MIEESILNRKRKAYILYEGNQSLIFSLKTNPITSREKSSIGKNVCYIDSKIILSEFNLPDSDYLFKEDIEFKNKNSFEFNLKYYECEYKSVEYNFDLMDENSNYFMFGLKIERNDTYYFNKNPPGKQLDSKLVELLNYLKFIVNKYVGEVKQLHVEGNDDKKNFVIKVAISLLNDLIFVFKKILKQININITTKDKVLYLSNFDTLVTEIKELSDHSFVFVLAICLLGIFPHNYFNFREFSLKTNSILLNLAIKYPMEIFLLIEQVPSLKENIINGLMILINMNIQEGKGSWTNLLSSNLMEKLFDKILFIERITEFVNQIFITLSIKEEEFQTMKNFMFKTLTKIETDLKNPSHIFKKIIKIISILSKFKENVLQLIIELDEMKKLIPENISLIKDDLRRKNWENDNSEKVIHWINLLRNLINKELDVSIKNELNSLLYRLSNNNNNITYIFLLIREFNYENLDTSTIREILSNNLGLSLENYAYILKELKEVPIKLKNEIISDSLFKKINSEMKKVNLP